MKKLVDRIAGSEHYVTYVMLHGGAMPKGKSGRVVLEIDPVLKQELYKALSTEDRTLKDWFLANAQIFIESRTQPGLFEPAAEKRKRRK